MSREEPKHILILGAFEPELAPLRAALDLAEHAPLRGLTTLELCGVGMVRAAATTASMLARRSADVFVLFVGSVGAVEKTTPLLTPVCATDAILADACEVWEDAFFPELMVVRYRASSELIEAARPKLPAGCCFQPVFSTSAITQRAEVAKALANATTARFESLELFGVAAACSAAEVPWISIASVTNHVASEGHEQWKESFRAAADATAALALPVVRALLGARVRR